MDTVLDCKTQVEIFSTCIKITWKLDSDFIRRAGAISVSRSLSRSKWYIDTSRRRVCSSRVQTQRVTFNCCIFNVNFLNNKNTQWFSVTPVNKFIFTVFMLCKLNTAMQVKHHSKRYQSITPKCPTFRKPFCVNESDVFLFFNMFLDTRLVHNFLYLSLKTSLSGIPNTEINN